MQQHVVLSELLLEYEYDVTYMAFPLGPAGGVYKFNFVALTEHLGVLQPEAHTRLKKLRMYAITSLIATPPLHPPSRLA